MINPEFSFIILTFNEEMHLPRLMDSIKPLNANTYVLDSGSTDKTTEICRSQEILIKYHAFVNHPKQWDAALKAFDISTPWVICLDADHILSPGLLQKLMQFRDREYQPVNGIYFNRKNYFKGKWIRYGGYYPKYLLKMFRYDVGYSDLSENMDHHFQVPGQTLIWKTEHLLEENLKENQISFWIAKHNTYSDLLAEEETTKQTTIPNFRKPRPWRSPNERKAWLKRIWQLLPLYIRPMLYFLNRMTFQLGFLDGRRGLIFHFLQSFWFRLLVDIKIEEARKNTATTKNSSVRFTCKFFLLFTLFYNFHLALIGLSTPGGFYLKFVAQHLNYISYWRTYCIHSTASILKTLNYQVHLKTFGLSVKGHAGFRLIYSCLGYGIISCFSAFVICFPKSTRSKILFLAGGLVSIQLLNISRFVLIALYYKPGKYDHHLLFNGIIYALVILATYCWINLQKPQKCRLR